MLAISCCIYQQNITFFYFLFEGRHTFEISKITPAIFNLSMQLLDSFPFFFPIRMSKFFIYHLEFLFLAIYQVSQKKCSFRIVFPSPKGTLFLGHPVYSEIIFDFEIQKKIILTTSLPF